MKSLVQRWTTSGHREGKSFGEVSYSDLLVAVQMERNSKDFQNYMVFREQRIDASNGQ